MSRVEQLKQVKEKRGLNGILFDVDDTIIDSSGSLWGPAFGFVASNLAHQAGVDETEVLESMWEINNDEYRKTVAGVHPSKYARVAEKLAEKYQIEKSWARGLMKEAVRMIYLGVPPLLPDAVEAMEIFEKVGFKEGLVTHSPPGRIKRMMRGWGLDGKVPAYTESTLRRKGPEVWLRAVAGLGLLGIETVAVDDNLGRI
jgi:beta-phosphoglucomutase-like phosphatase (HAD superfamily)